MTLSHKNKRLYLANLLLLFLFSFLPIIANKNNAHKSLIVTVPKSGTHLLKKCIILLNMDGVKFSHKKASTAYHVTNMHNSEHPSLVNIFKDQKIITRHLLHTEKTEKFVEQNTYANLFLIRDPRSQLVSAAFATKKKRIGAQKRSIEELLLDFILARNENFIPMARHSQFQQIQPDEILFKLDLLWRIGILGFYNRFIPWMKAKNFYTVRFENLVGPRGGGSEQTQIQEIKNITQHFGLTRSDEEIKHIANNLFGDTNTFREGKIDSWKKEFTPAVKKAFKANSELMQMLITLGYEKDCNW